MLTIAILAFCAGVNASMSAVRFLLGNGAAGLINLCIGAGMIASVVVRLSGAA